MAENLAGKAFEVLTADGSRWLYESTFDTRSAALRHAEELLHVGSHGGVRVVAESKRTGDEEVIFEERIDRDKVIKLVAIDSASPCEGLADFYRFPARRTAGRLLRHYLDDQGVTALELAMKPGLMMMFERNERLFGPAIQRIAGIQAKVMGVKAAERSEELFKVFEQMKARARKAADQDKYAALLDSKGINALVTGAGQWKKTKEGQEFAIRGALASLIGGRGDWNGKLQVLIGLLRDGPSAAAVAYVDEVMAEILDGAEAVREVLGGAPDSATANRALIHLACGRVLPPKKPISCIVELNEALYRLNLPLTRAVLLERVRTEIGGIRPLTREDRDADHEAFVGLVRELVEDDGLMGGPGMAEAVLKRARMTMTTTDVDLIVEQAINKLLDVMPNRAVRLGFLLDLAESPAGRADRIIVTEALDRLMHQLSFLASLVPDASGPEKVVEVVEGLKRRLTYEALPEDWRKGAAATLDALVTRATGGSGKKNAKQGTKGYTVDDGRRRMADPTGERRAVNAGETIFLEGEVGDLAYLIVSGEVEIFRTGGNRERVLATLGRGEIIGEMSLIDEQPRVASARALQDTELTAISRESLQRRLDRLDETDKVLRRLIAVLVSRIRGQALSPE